MTRMFSRFSAFCRCLLATATVLFGVADMAVAEEQSTEYRLLLATVNERLVPAHQRLYDQSKLLNSAAKGFCEKPGNASLKATRESWLQAMLAWQALSMIDFGPVETTNARFLFQFWPDPLNLVERKLATRIAGKNPDISPEQLAQASVAVQGLSAMEYLLFDEAIAKVRRYAGHKHLCRILTATAANLEANAGQLNRLWADFGKRYVSPELEKSHPGYFVTNVEKLFSSLITSLETIKNRKLGAALGIAPVLPSAIPGEETSPAAKSRAANAFLLEGWRSRTSLRQIRANLQSGLGLYEMPHGFGWYMTQQSPESGALDRQIRADYAAAIAQIDALDHSAFELLQRNQPEALMRLHDTVGRLSQRLQLDYAKAAQLDYTFNARDGD